MMDNHVKRRILRPILAAAAAAMLLAGCSKGGDSEIAKIRQNQHAGKIEAVAQQTESQDTTVARVAVEVLGHMGREAVAPIQKALQDKRPEIRGSAVVALAEADPVGQQAAVAEVARKDEAAGVRASACVALGEVYAFDQMETLFTALEDPDRTVRARAASAITRMITRRYELYIDGPADKRHQAVQNLRQAWPQLDKTVRLHQEILHGKKGDALKAEKPASPTRRENPPEFPG
jgi:HEAT repeat protein